MLNKHLLCFVFFLSYASFGMAGEFRLDVPVRCVAQDGCQVFQYFDHDPGPGWKDYACGQRSYDGHTGTDFRVRDLGVMARGVSVVASAPGVVRAVRDGVEDADARTLSRDALAGREAGNAVVLLHDGGYETQYSHLKRGSVAVKKGQHVEAGQVLGLVGMSGLTAFPHVELRVRRGLMDVDPFTGSGAGDDPALCGPGTGVLWSQQALRALAYTETDLLGAGFALGAVSMADAERGIPDLEALPEDAEALALWFLLAGVREGDVLHSAVTVPGGKVLVRDKRPLAKTQVQYFQFVGGRRATGEVWPQGTYEGRIVLRRKGAGDQWRTVLDKTRRITVH